MPGEELTGAAPVREETASRPATPLVHVRTPVLEAWIDRSGGDIVGLQLPTYTETIDSDVPVRLLDRNQQHVYLAQSGLVGRDGLDKSSGTRPLYVAEQSDYRIDNGDLTVALRHATDTVSVVKRFRFAADSYVVDVEHTVENRGDVEFRARQFAQLKRDSSRPGAGGGFFMGPRPYVGAAFTTPDSRYEKIDFDDLDEAPFRAELKGGWSAMLQHYFLTAWIGDSEEVNAYNGRRLGDGNYAVGFVGPEFVVAPGGATFDEHETVRRAKDSAEPGSGRSQPLLGGGLWLSLVAVRAALQSSGSHLFGGRQLGSGHHRVDDRGQGAALPAGVGGFSLHGEDALGDAADEAFAGAPRRRPAEAHAGNDGALQERGGQSVWRLSAAGVADAGVLGFVLGALRKRRAASCAVHAVDRGLGGAGPWFVLPILYAASFYVMQLLQPPPADPMQAKVMKMMPIMFTVLFLFFPAGLVLYWLVNNVLSLAQQWYITRSVEKAAAKPA